MIIIRLGIFRDMSCASAGEIEFEQFCERILFGTSATPTRARSSRALPFTCNNNIAVSMDGKGAWRDNVFVERL